MHWEPGVVLSRFRCAQGLIEGLFRQARTLPLRASALASGLCSLCPDSPVLFALLAEGGATHAAAVDADGRPLPELAEAGRAALAALHRTDGDKAAGCFPFPPSLGRPGQVLLFHEITCRGAHRGYLGAAVREGDIELAVTATVTLLSLCADLAGLLLDREALESELAGARAELTGQGALADVAELAGPLAHEINNFLNVLLLQVAALADEVPGRLREDLASLRRQGLAAGRLVKQWQAYRQQARQAPGPVDLNSIVHEAVEELSRVQEGRPRDGSAGDGCAVEAVSVVTRLAEDLPPVAGRAHDFRRLLTFLLKNAIAALGGRSGPVCVETEAAESKVRLHVKDCGPEVPAERLPVLFDPNEPAREGTNALELAACASIARRHRGKLRGSSCPGGGLAITLELPASGERGASAS